MPNRKTFGCGVLWFQEIGRHCEHGTVNYCWELSSKHGYGGWNSMSGLLVIAVKLAIEHAAITMAASFSLTKNAGSPFLKEGYE
jgi:hypothetical protein